MQSVRLCEKEHTSDDPLGSDHFLIPVDDLLGTEVCFQRVHGTAQTLKIGIAYHKVGKEEINIL